MFKKIMKKVAVVVAAATMALAALPVSASAASWKSGDTTVTANIYITADQNEVMSTWDAYFTNTAVPPRTAVSNNATVHVTDEGVFLEVPVENSKFGICVGSFSASAFSGMTLTGGEYEETGCSTDGHAVNRYTSLIFQLPDTPSTSTYSGHYEDGTGVTLTYHGKVSLPLFGISLKDVKDVAMADYEFDLSNAIE